MKRDPIFRRKPISLIRLLFIVLVFTLTCAGIYMSQQKLPHSAEHYHDKRTEIEHDKQIRNQDETIKQVFRFKIKVKDNQMRLVMQKDGQHSKTMTKEPQVNAITMDVLQKLLLFMEFDKNKLKGMSKSDMVQFVCQIFHIPTKDALKICDVDCINIIQNQIDMIEEEPMIYNLIEYIVDNQSNMTVIADIIELCEEKQIDLFDGFFCLWLGLIDIFQLHKNDDIKFKKEFYNISKSNKLKAIQNDLKTDIQSILNEYNINNNKQIKLKGFWFSFSLLTMKLFNYSVKHFILCEYIQISADPSQLITEQRRCAIYKYFGSSLHSLEKDYKGKDYGKEKSKHLLYICDKCLLSYDTFEQQICEQKNQDDDNNEYLTVPLKLRLQNRGRLRFLKEPFYKNVAIGMYSIIFDDVNRIFSCYDPKQVQAIEKKIMNNELIFKAFDNHIGKMDIGEERIYKLKVLKELSHKVTSRFVMSMIKRHKKYDGHVGDFRTGVKTLSNRK